MQSRTWQLTPRRDNSVHGAFISVLAANARRGMTLGRWKLEVDENSGAFSWVHTDMQETDEGWSIPIVWASPYWEGCAGIALMVQRVDGEAEGQREIAFDGTLAGYKRVLRHVLATVDPTRRI